VFGCEKGERYCSMFEKLMVSMVAPDSKVQSFKRVSVVFGTQEGTSSFDEMIGKAAHTLFLSNVPFLRLFAKLYGQELFG